MTAEVTEKLQSIIRENGRAVVRNPKLCEAIMADELADFASSARVLRLALRCGIPSALEGGAPTEADVARFTELLEQQGVFGIKARDAIETWAKAMGIVPAGTIDAGIAPMPNGVAASRPFPVTGLPARETASKSVESAPAGLPADGDRPHEAPTFAAGAGGARKPGNLKPAGGTAGEPLRWVAAILLVSLAAGATAGGVWPMGVVLGFIGYCVAPSC